MKQSPTHIAMQQASTGIHNNCVEDARLLASCIKVLGNLINSIDTPDTLKFRNTVSAAKVFLGRYHE